MPKRTVTTRVVDAVLRELMPEAARYARPSIDLAVGMLVGALKELPKEGQMAFVKALGEAVGLEVAFRVKSEAKVKR